MFDGFISRFVVREFLIFLKFLKVFCFMLICTHLAACVWFFVGYSTMGDRTNSWLTTMWPQTEGKQSLIDEIDIFEKYTYSWYWAVVTVNLCALSVAISWRIGSIALRTVSNAIYCRSH